LVRLRPIKNIIFSNTYSYTQANYAVNVR